MGEHIQLKFETGSKIKLLTSVGTGVTNIPDSTSLVTYLGVQVLLGEK